MISTENQTKPWFFIFFSSGDVPGGLRFFERWPRGPAWISFLASRLFFFFYLCNLAVLTSISNRSPKKADKAWLSSIFGSLWRRFLTWPGGEVCQGHKRCQIAVKGDPLPPPAAIRREKLWPSARSAVVVAALFFFSFEKATPRSPLKPWSY